MLIVEVEIVVKEHQALAGVFEAGIESLVA
jgi:hypothetical protein